MPRTLLTDEIWAQLQIIMIEKGCKTHKNNRNVMEAQNRFSLARCSRSFVPLEHSVQPFQSMVAIRTLGRLFFCLRGKVEANGVFADGSYVPAHQHASGARCGEERAIGKSRAGNTTKVHFFTNENGSPIDFEVTGGEVHDSKVAERLIEMASAELNPTAADPIVFCGDKGYDSEEIRQRARANNLLPMIPRRRNSVRGNPEFKKEIYKLRHVVENLFARLKHYRGIETRFEKLAQNFRSSLKLAFTLVGCGYHLMSSKVTFIELKPILYAAS